MSRPHGNLEFGEGRMSTRKGLKKRDVHSCAFLLWLEGVGVWVKLVDGLIPSVEILFKVPRRENQNANSVQCNID